MYPVTMQNWSLIYHLHMIAIMSRDHVHAPPGGGGVSYSDLVWMGVCLLTLKAPTHFLLGKVQKCRKYKFQKNEKQIGSFPYLAQPGA